MVSWKIRFAPSPKACLSCGHGEPDFPRFLPLGLGIKIGGNLRELKFALY